ncbi:hypothetical protein BDQ17DRAFT_1431902 [Cyathus striatus]|nr:hypothetical protein BDQ17DRAFT_1431902 [Cyathus striatus]
MPPRAKPAPKKQASAFYNYEMPPPSAIDAHLPTPVIRQLFPHSILPFPSFAPRGSPYRCRYLGNASGVVMPIEAISIPGKGGLWVKTHAYDLGITESPDNQFLTNRDIHVHMPEGSIGKEGHSMGTAILSAFVSLFTKTKIDQDIGEYPLRSARMLFLITSPPPSTLSALHPRLNSKTIRPATLPQVLALPITCHRLFPGFYKAVAIRNSSVITALKEMMKQGQPYLGAFFLKDPMPTQILSPTLTKSTPLAFSRRLRACFQPRMRMGRVLQLFCTLTLRICITELVKAGDEKEMDREKAASNSTQNRAQSQRTASRIH